MAPQHAIVGGGGAMPVDSDGIPWNGKYIASGNLLADFRVNAAARVAGVCHGGVFVVNGAAGGSIQVKVAALHALREAIEKQVGQAEVAASQVARRGGQLTGVSEVDEAIAGVAQALDRQMGQLSSAGRELGGAVGHAAGLYEDTEQGLAELLLPSGGPAGGDPADGPINPALRPFTGGGNQ